MSKKVVHIGWLYYDLLDLYGDIGNIRVLERRLENRGVKVKLSKVSVGDKFKVSDFDIIFIGGGADQEQSIVYPDLIARKDDFKKAIDQGSFVLAICGGYQLLGKHYIDANGNELEGLNFFNYDSKAPSQGSRCIGNVEINVNLGEKEISIVGFENHGGQTFNVDKPFGKVVKGHGNVFNGEFEGVMEGNVIGTYLHGPLLPKNPELADYIIEQVANRKGIELLENTFDDSFAKLAKKKIKERM